MAPAQDPQPLTVSCPNCGKGFSTQRVNVGKRARCPGCAHIFVITTAGAAVRAAEAQPAAKAAPSTATAKASVPSRPATGGQARSTTGRVCSICQSPAAAGERLVACPDCRSVFHAECWEYNRGCGVYGCSQAPPTESLTSLEIPPSYWGSENKVCPRCGQVILAAAVRCRQCGATFDSASPQDVFAYRDRQQIKASLPMVRRVIIVLLVFSIFPCTAPLAAPIGLIWFAMNREKIAALPAVYAALSWIALGLASFQTAMFVVVALLYTALHG